MIESWQIPELRDADRPPEARYSWRREPDALRDRFWLALLGLLSLSGPALLVLTGIFS